MFGDERPQLTAGSQLGNQVIANMLHNINLAFGIIIVGDFRYGFFISSINSSMIFSSK